MPLRLGFEKELKKLHVDIIKMGAAIESSIDDVIKSIEKKDIELAKEIIKKDDEIDEWEQLIEKKCINLIARQNPAASDLREITSILKMITDLERIADHCEDISEIIIEIADESYVKKLVHIRQMANIIKEMVHNTIDSYVKRDVENSINVCKRDDDVDELYNVIVLELEEIMKNDTTKIHQCVNLIALAKYFERMADHATNICEWIIYDITGQHKSYN